MSNHELRNLLNRAAAALETPDDLSAEDKQHLIEDLAVAARPLTTYTATVVLMAEDQQEVLDAFGDLVGACINVANDYPTLQVAVAELDPTKLVHS